MVGATARHDDDPSSGHDGAVTRLFVAAWPPAGVTESVIALPRPAEPGVRWVPSPNLHVTLRFIGEAVPEAIEEALGCAELPRCTARLGPGVSRLGPRQLVIPAAGVDDLANAVRTATSGHGDSDQRRFRGHLTVARTKRGAHSTTYGAPFEATWTIDEIALVTSELGPSGAAYATLATFPTA
jgi:2'-5' RNA ligase